MSRPGHPGPRRLDAERRLAATYTGYKRKRRAWKRDNPGNRAIRAELTRHLLELAAPVLRGRGDALDVGCGTGWWLAALAENGVAPSRLHGVDLLRGRIERAQRAVPGASLVHADACALPFEDDRFALVTFLVTLSSLPGPRAVAAALREARRVVEPGGLVLCWEPRVANLLNRRTRRVRVAEMSAVLGPAAEIRTLTVLPPLVRRLGGLAPALYPALSTVPPLRTHVLTAHRPGAGR